jgi:hypothetical protein
MDNTNDSTYVIPARYRKMENMHIVFWLFKDVSWCMNWKVLGIAMIVPTMVIAVMIAWRTRDIKSEMAHNLAIMFWISANSFWMISEFLHFDTVMVWHGISGKHLALIPFTLGGLVLAWYYLIQKPKEERAAQVITI